LLEGGSRDNGGVNRATTRSVHTTRAEVCDQRTTASVYLRHAEAATAVGAYSIRARANAPVSTPVEWSELDRDVRFDHFNIAAVMKRVAKLKRDPWARMAAAARPLDKAMMAKVGYRRR